MSDYIATNVDNRKIWLRKSSNTLRSNKVSKQGFFRTFFFSRKTNIFRIFFFVVRIMVCVSGRFILFEAEIFFLVQNYNILRFVKI